MPVRFVARALAAVELLDMNTLMIALADNALDADDQEDSPCSACDAVFPFPATEEDVRACSDCIRSWKAAFTQDTELSMVRWEDALWGVT